MDKELYVISRLLDGDWEFTGAFKTSDEASNYMQNYNGDHIIAPCDLAKSFNTVFDEYRYCFDCDKYPHDNDKKLCFLIEAEHSAGVWHFECLLPSLDKAYSYSRECPNKRLRTIYLKLPWDKNTLFQNLATIRHNQNVSKDKELSNERIREMKQMNLESAIYQNNKMLRIGLFLLAILAVKSFF